MRTLDKNPHRHTVRSSSHVEKLTTHDGHIWRARFPALAPPEAELEAVQTPETWRTAGSAVAKHDKPAYDSPPARQQPIRGADGTMPKPKRDLRLTGMEMQ